MIFFKTIKWKNFLSTGQHWTEIDLCRSKSTLVVGENGAGKSTMLDAISFALYGKPFRKINKNQLINSVNKKNLEVEIAFNIGESDYVLKRGIKPNLFEIWKNGELVNQDAALRDYQAYFEQNVLKMNFKSFSQIVVLGSSTFVPFMQLSAANRREVIEDLLDIQVFSTMATLLKDKVQKNKTELLECKYQVDLCEQKIESAKDHSDEIRRMKSIEVDKIKLKVAEILDRIEEEERYIDAIEKIIQICVDDTNDRQSVEKKREELMSMKRKIDFRKDSIIKEMTFFENHDNCPTCKQGIDHDFKGETVESHTAKLEEIKAGQDKLDEKLAEVEDRLRQIAEVDKQANSATLKAGEHRANIRSAKSQLAGFKQDLMSAEKEFEEVDSKKLVEMIDQLSALNDNLSDLSFHKETLTVATSILRDGGIKTRIIKQYVPVINKLVNKYLSALEFFVDFNLDEQFNETIKSRFRDDFSYGSFSEGERTRIDLSLMLTWRAVSRLRNSVSTNLLIMDEVFDSSLDQTGVDELIKILGELTSDSNVFIISHKPEALQDKFETTLNFVKEKGFSQLAA